MKTDVAIIGGGPGGSAAAMFLSQTGLRVTLIEKAQSARYHIGESLTGECGNCLRTLGLEAEMTSRRHPVKYGQKFLLGSRQRMASGVGPFRYAYMVGAAE
ncbi:MAG: hypothetical protein DMF26_14370 [Verrucomicrobia bacterium]|nr:MAG: hypothetical protein DMF26_14370 [Verrucomicrobiota bacterium]